MAIIATGIDLAKNVFALHGVSETGAVLLRQPKVARAKLNALVAGLPPGVIGMDACSGAHFWSRQFLSGPRPHGAADGAQAGHALPHERQAGQERRG